MARPTGWSGSLRSTTHWSGWVRRTSPNSRRPSREVRHRCRARDHRRAQRRHRGLSGRVAARGGRARWRRPSSIATRSRPRSRHRRTRPASGPHDTVMVHPAKLAWGLAEAAERLGVEIYENSYVSAINRLDDGKIEVTTRQGRCRGGQGRARHQRVSVAGQARAPLRRPGLRLRDRDRAADQPSSARPSAGATGRASATLPTSSTTTGRPPTTGSCSAGTTRSTTSARRSTRELDQRDETFELLAEHFFETLPQLAGPRSSPMPGVARSTCAHGSVRSSVRRTAARSPTPPATPVSASAPPVSGPT